MKTLVRWGAIVFLAIALVGSAAVHAETSIPTTVTAGAAIVDVDALTIYLTMNATLTEAASGAPIPGQKIDFFVGSSSRELCTGVTNANGEASCGGILGAVNATINLGYTAVYIGYEPYQADSDEGSAVRVAGADLP